MEPLSIQYDAMKLLPILEWSKTEIEAYLDDHNLPRHPLQAEGYVSVGDWHSSRPRREDDVSDRDTRFGGIAEECGLHTDGVTKAESTKKRSVASPLGGTMLDAYNLSGNDTHPTVLMVKKRMKDGRDCRRCEQIQELIERDELEKHVDATVFAIEGEENSEGVRLSKEFGMRTAPFFVVRMPGEKSFEAVESYYKLRKMIRSYDKGDAGRKANATAESSECEIDFTYDGVQYTEGNCASPRAKKMASQ